MAVDLLCVDNKFEGGPVYTCRKIEGQVSVFYGHNIPQLLNNKRPLILIGTRLTLS
jgi:hypothetical protein